MGRRIDFENDLCTWTRANSFLLGIDHILFTEADGH